MYQNQPYRPPLPWGQQYPTATHHNGPPPAKRPRGGGGMTITRYPPPPGYTGPAPQQPPHSPWPQANQAHGHGHAPFQQPSPHHPPGPYAQPAPPAYPAYSPAGYQQPYGYPPPASHPYTAPPATGHSSIPAPYSAQPPSWPPQNNNLASYFPDQSHLSADQVKGRRQNSVPNVTLSRADPQTGGYPPALLVSQAGQTLPDALESDFDEECYYATHPEEIDPNFSLGMIESQFALPTKFPLPATFQEAELEALAPRAPRATNEDSISEYFTPEKREEVFHSVRTTAAWNNIKNDIIFREIPPTTRHLISRPELKRRFRNRPDSEYVENSFACSRGATPHSPYENGSASSGTQDHDVDAGATDFDRNDRRSHDMQIKAEDACEDDDVLFNLEQALQGDRARQQSHPVESIERRRSTHSRATSVSSRRSEKLSRPQPLPAIRDQAQEDVLASLGVTGSPKSIYQTPGPAFGPPPPGHDASARSSRRNSATAVAHNAVVVPPPPPALEQPEQAAYLDPWDPYGNAKNSRKTCRRGSASSQHTAAGSDFYEDTEATPKPKQDNRKRGHDDSQDDHPNGQVGFDNDETPRQRRKQRRVDQAGG